MKQLKLQCTEKDETALGEVVGELNAYKCRVQRGRENATGHDCDAST